MSTLTARKPMKRTGFKRKQPVSIYKTAALCPDCHQGSFLGWHGQKRAWTVRKMDELDALNVTLKRLLTT